VTYGQPPDSEGVGPGLVAERNRVPLHEKRTENADKKHSKYRSVIWQEETS
jgi:hypothetical protein